MIEFVAVMLLCGFLFILCYCDNKVVRALFLKIFFAFLFVAIIWAVFFKELYSLIAN